MAGQISSPFRPAHVDIEHSINAVREAMHSVHRGNGAAPGSGQTRPSHSTYTPQFSASQSRIFSRISQHAASHPRETRRAISTLPLPMAHLSDDEPSIFEVFSAMNSAGAKRKRSEMSVDFSQATIPLPTHDGPPHPEAPKTPKTKRCHQCERREPQTPMLTCTQCSSAWHRECLPPMLGQPVPNRLDILCINCLRPQEPSPTVHVPEERRERVEGLRQRSLSGLPEFSIPKEGLVGFTAGGASQLARTEYFLGKSSVELLNLLSFADQMEPQLLVDMLVSVSRRHPELPIFDAPDWAASCSRAALAKPVVRRPRVQQRLRHVLHASKAKHRVKRPRKEATAGDVVEEVIYLEEDAVPTTWPTAGEGLYAQLIPEVEDRKFLVEENDEEAFSHFMVDKMGRQIVQPV